MIEQEQFGMFSVCDKQWNKWPMICRAGPCVEWAGPGQDFLCGNRLVQVGHSVPQAGAGWTHIFGLCRAPVPVASASGYQHVRSASMGILQVPRGWIMIGRWSVVVAGPSQSSCCSTETRDDTAHFQATTEGLPVPHLMCCKQKKHSPLHGAVVVFSWFWHWIQNCTLIYLLILLSDVFLCTLLPCGNKREWLETST